MTKSELANLIVEFAHWDGIKNPEELCRRCTLVASVVDRKSTKTTFTITVAQCVTTICCLTQYRSDWMRSTPELTA